MIKDDILKIRRIAVEKVIKKKTTENSCNKKRPLKSTENNSEKRRSLKTKRIAVMIDHF